jgi:hypothetical protein
VGKRLGGGIRRTAERNMSRAFAVHLNISTK